MAELNGSSKEKSLKTKISDSWHFLAFQHCDGWTESKSFKNEQFSSRSKLSLDTLRENQPVGSEKMELRHLEKSN